MNTALQHYKSFVDGIVKISEGVEEVWVRERGWPKLPENDHINKFLGQLNKNQKDVLVQLLNDARHGGIHDTLVYLHDAVSGGEIKLMKEGVEMPVDHFESLYYDWHCRTCGDAWPDERPPQK